MSIFRKAEKRDIPSLRTLAVRSGIGPVLLSEFCENVTEIYGCAHWSMTVFFWNII